MEDPQLSAPLLCAVAFADLFDGLGTLALAYRGEASVLDGREVTMTGFIAHAHGPAGRDHLVETPGACPDCTPVPVAAVALDWLETPPPATGAVVVHGRLGVGFELADDGTAPFLHLTGARLTPLPRAVS